MLLSIITPEKILIEAEARLITLPGSDGEFGVLDGHAPFVSTIRPGVIAIEMDSGALRSVAITGGIAEIVPERCTVLAELAEECGALSALEARTRLDAAKADHAQALTETDRQAAARRLALAEAAALAA